MNNFFDYALASVVNAQPGFFEKLLPAMFNFLTKYWFWLLIILTIIPIIISYIYLSICLSKIAKKTNTSNSWFAWVPILNIYLACGIAGKPGIWVFWLLIPIINIIPGIILYFAIVKRLKVSAWWAILMLLPVTNIVVPGILAFSGNENIVEEKKPNNISTPNVSISENKTVKRGLNKKFCSGCGGELQASDKFCLNCGTKL